MCLYAHIEAQEMTRHDNFCSRDKRKIYRDLSTTSGASAIFTSFTVYCLHKRGLVPYAVYKEHSYACAYKGTLEAGEGEETERAGGEAETRGLR